MSMWHGCRPEVLAHNRIVQLDPTNNTDYSGSPYAYGMDPVSAEGRIAFVWRRQNLYLSATLDLLSKLILPWIDHLSTF